MGYCNFFRVRNNTSNMFKLSTVAVLLGLAAVVCANAIPEESSPMMVEGEETHDQESAEQFFATYGYYPSWYTSAVYTAPAVKTVAVKTVVPAATVVPPPPSRPSLTPASAMPDSPTPYSLTPDTHTMVPRLPPAFFKEENLTIRYPVMRDNFP